MAKGKSETLRGSETNIFSASPRLSLAACKRNRDSETTRPVKFHKFCETRIFRRTTRHPYYLLQKSTFRPISAIKFSLSVVCILFVYVIYSILHASDYKVIHAFPPSVANGRNSDLLFIFIVKALSSFVVHF